MKFNNAKVTIALSLVAFLSLVANGQISIPYVFQSGYPAIAEEVNANFSALEAAVNENSVAINNASSKNTYVHTITAYDYRTTGVFDISQPQMQLAPRFFELPVNSVLTNLSCYYLDTSSQEQGLQTARLIKLTTIQGVFSPLEVIAEVSFTSVGGGKFNTEEISVAIHNHPYDEAAKYGIAGLNYSVCTETTNTQFCTCQITYEI